VRPTWSQDREVKGEDRERKFFLAKVEPPENPPRDPGAGGRRPGGSVPPEGAGVADTPESAADVTRRQR